MGEMSKFCPLFSSSKGNCTYLSGGGTSLLVDAGISLRQLTAAMARHDLSPRQLDGILITHEHTDHTRGLSALLKKYPMPLYASSETLLYLTEKNMLPPGISIFEIYTDTIIGAIQVTPFQTPHDANHSIGFCFHMPDDRKIAIATDLGHISETVHDHITGCDLVMLESNYDPHMLDASSYPYALKRRIRGNIGHLSNEACADECLRLIESGTTRLFLAHLSEKNNLPLLAHQVTQSVLQQANMKEGTDYLLNVAPARDHSVLTVF